ncbi:hypothetical protein BDV18DRAFT_152484 [Aspergillus unguis]
MLPQSRTDKAVSYSLAPSQVHSIKSSSLSFPAQSTELSASLQRNSMEIITTEAEQHNPSLSNTMNIQSGGSPDTPNTLLVTFYNGRDSSTTISSPGLLNLPSDLPPIISETGPPTINSKAPPILSVLTAIVVPESDCLLLTGWNALSEIDTLSLDFAPTTTAALLVETLPAPEKIITVSILTVWSSPNQEDSLNQEARLTAYIGPVEDPSQLYHISYIHQLNGGSLNAIAEGETALISSSIPPVLNKHNRGGLVLNFTKTKEICDSGLYGTTARLMKENQTTLILINMVLEKPAVLTDMPIVPYGLEGRPLITIISNTVTSTIRVVSAGIIFFILIFILHCVIWISHEPNMNVCIESLPRRSQNPEVSYFSDGS